MILQKDCNSHRPFYRNFITTVFLIALTGSFLYPLYAEVQRPAITLLNLATQYNLALGKHNVGIGLKINNLLDARTFSVTSGQTGLEVGRSFWLEVSYEL